MRLLFMLWDLLIDIRVWGRWFFPVLLLVLAVTALKKNGRANGDAHLPPTGPADTLSPAVEQQELERLKQAGLITEKEHQEWKEQL